MKTRTSGIRVAYAGLIFCLGTTSAAIGQVVQSQPPPPVPTTGSINNGPLSPEQEARFQQQCALDSAAAMSLHMGRFMQAEAQARQALSLGQDSGVAEEVLAEALEKQGLDQDALQQYHKMVVDERSDFPRVHIPYAQLLLKAGRWAEAVAAYNFDPGKPKPGSDFPDWAEGRFSPDVPEPKAFAVALHIARGQDYTYSSDWAGEPQNTEAMAEYEKALALEPDSARANFFYGFGWKRLSPDERGKYGTDQQAKAALLKAVRLGKGDVKKAAEKELRVAMNPTMPAKVTAK